MHLRIHKKPVFHCLLAGIVFLLFVHVSCSCLPALADTNTPVLQPKIINNVKSVGQKPEQSESITLEADAESIATALVEAPGAGSLQLFADIEKTTCNIRIGVYADEAYTLPIGPEIDLTSSILEGYSLLSVPSAGTYYIKAAYYQYDRANQTSQTVHLAASYYCGEDSVLKAKSTHLFYTGDTENTLYHKITVSKAGLINIKGYGIYFNNKTKRDLHFTLCDDQKKAISMDCRMSHANSYKDSFVVEKGSYYICASDLNPYTLSYTFKAFGTESSYGTQDKNAKKQQPGSTINGYLSHGDAPDQVKYYAISLKRDTKLTLTMSTTGYDKAHCTARLYSYKKGKQHTITQLVGDNEEKALHICKNKKLKKGTYYLAISKSEMETGISYSISIDDTKSLKAAKKQGKKK